MYFEVYVSKLVTTSIELLPLGLRIGTDTDWVCWTSACWMSMGGTNTAVYYARIFEVQKWTLFAPSVCDFIFELPCTSVESYSWLHVIKNKHSDFFILYGDHTYHV